MSALQFDLYSPADQAFRLEYVEIYKVSTTSATTMTMVEWKTENRSICTFFVLN